MSHRGISNWNKWKNQEKLFQHCRYYVVPAKDWHLKLDWIHYHEVTLIAQNLDYTATISLSQALWSPVSAGNKGNRTMPYFEIHLIRKSFRYFLETIIPIGLLVVVSWVRRRKGDLQP